MSTPRVTRRYGVNAMRPTAYEERAKSSGNWEISPVPHGPGDVATQRCIILCDGGGGRSVAHGRSLKNQLRSPID